MNQETQHPETEESFIKKSLVIRDSNNLSLTYDEFMSNMDESITNRYYFLHIEETKSVSIIDKGGNVHHITIPLENIQSIRQYEGYIVVYAMSKFYLSIFKNVDLITISIF
jgi:hypothetical protein